MKGYAWGTVTRTGVTLTYDSTGMDIVSEFYVRGLTESAITNGKGTDPTDSGDSGGPIYIRDNGVYKIHGTNSATHENTVTGLNDVVYSSPIYYAEYEGFELN